MISHIKAASYNKALLAAIGVVTLGILALIIIIPMTQWAYLGITWLVALDLGLVNFALPEDFYRT